MVVDIDGCDYVGNDDGDNEDGDDGRRWTLDV